MWASFVAAWLARAADDRRLRALGGGTDAAFTVRSGADVVWIHLCGGEVADHALDDGFDRRVDFGLTAPAEVWERLWQPIPTPRHQSLFALMTQIPEFHVEGSREALAQHAHVVARLLELVRGPGEPFDPSPPDLSGVTGRYVAAGGAQLFVEEAGTGRDLLLLHTAGSDARQFHHLFADRELRDGWHMV